MQNQKNGQYGYMIQDIPRQEAKDNLAPNNIAAYRKAADLTQQQLAELVGSHWITISKLERGVIQLTENWMRKLSKPLKVAPKDLLLFEVEDITAHIQRTIDATGAIVETENKTFTVPANVVTMNVTWCSLQGDFLLPWYSRGDLLGFSLNGVHKKPSDLIGRFCHCMDKDGHEYIGILNGSVESGLFDVAMPGRTPDRAKAILFAEPLFISLSLPSKNNDAKK